MNIKSLLIGSAAAFAAVSGAQAADAIVAAEPEPMEYVRVCDAFGTGYFYIPGTETCLKIGGYVRFQLDMASEDAPQTVGGVTTTLADSGYHAFTRGYLSLDTKSDTELGTLTGHIDLQADSHQDTFLDGAWIQLGGFKVGYFYNFWDKGINGETDSLGSNLLNAASYTFENGAFAASVALETFSNSGSVYTDFGDGWGVSGLVTGSFGAVTADLLGSYDFDAEEGAIRALISAEVGPGTLQAAAIWASGSSTYYSEAEWAVAASYALKATEKLTITPGVQYWGNTNFDAAGSPDKWRVGLTAGYAITEGLNLLATVNYTDPDGANDYTTGFLRLERSF